MTDTTEDISSKWLLPRNWHTAPKQYWNVDRTGMFMFCVMNFAFGTIGLWVPVVIAALTGKSVGEVCAGMLKAGNGYLFVIPFIASIVFSVLETKRTIKETKSSGRFDLITVIALLACVVCAILLVCQIQADGKVASLNYFVQITACIFITAVGLYMFCLVKSEMNTSVADDINQRADQITAGAKSARPEARDFE